MGLESSRVPLEPLRTTRNGRRFFSEEHKRLVVERCLAPGASVSAVSLAHGFNTNLVRKWIRAHQARQSDGAGKLVPVTVREAREVETPRRFGGKPAAPEHSSGSSVGAIEIEFGAARLLVRGPIDVEQLRLVLGALARYR